MKKGIILVCMSTMPLMGMADIVINAYAQDGAMAYVYDESGIPYGTTTFSGGVAVIDMAGTPNGMYGLAMSYAPGQPWYTDIAWRSDVGVEPTQYKYFEGNSWGVTIDAALTGAITGRSLNGSIGTITLSANGPLGLYNNETNELDAALGLYRPVQATGEIGGSMTRTWDSAGLAAGYAYTTEIWSQDAAYSLITVTNNAGDFQAQYVGADVGGGSYDLLFHELDTGTAYADGSIVANGNGVDFTVNGLGTGSYVDGTPYYLVMDEAWMYDQFGSYSRVLDVGMSLTDPTHYVIPEPAVVTLIAAAGCCMIGYRRLFKA